MRAATPAGGRAGFTLLEVLVVISIITFLVGTIFAAANIVQNIRRKGMTRNLMNQLTASVDMYLDRYAMLGWENDAHDFVAEPWAYLHRNRVEARLEPYLVLEPGQLVRRTDPVLERYTPITAPTPGAKTKDSPNMERANLKTATHIIDFFGSYIYQWRILNGRTGDRYYTYLVELRSQAGTPEDPEDDIVLYMNSLDDPVTVDGLTYEPTGADWRQAQHRDLLP